MGEWKKTGCMLCAQSCGLEVLIEGDRLVKSKPDRTNPRSRGYVCRKGLNVAHFQDHTDRLTQPLKRVDGRFVPISWDQALDEIAAKLKTTVADYGPRSLAYMGGGGQSCQFEAAFGVRLLRGLGSHYHYNALGQELNGHLWVTGRMAGKQGLFPIPDEHRSEMLVAWGWNGWMSHQMARARKVLGEISKNPDRLLVVIDPRLSETARRADMHLVIRPGTDALLMKALIAMILDRDDHDADYLKIHTSGFDQITPWFDDFDIKAAIKVCGLEYNQVEDLCGLLTTKKWSVHPDLGLYMTRHSTMVSYLLHLLTIMCGRFGVPGGVILPGTVMPLGSHSDERNPKTWRTVATDFPAIAGVYPPNVMPEEIMTDHPDRLRAVICSQSNPLRSYADTSAYEQAFAKLDLLVTIDLAMTETATLSHYVLPARSGFESWDGTFYTWNYPEVFFQMRRPVIKPKGDPWEASQIFTELADRLGLLPDIPDTLIEAGKHNRMDLATAYDAYAKKEPKAAAMFPFIMAKTLGKHLGSANQAQLWGMLMNAPKSLQELATRAGFKPGPAMGEDIYKAAMDHPEGFWIGHCDPDNNFEMLRTKDKKLSLFIPELAEMVQKLDAKSEAQALAKDPDFPFILNAGRHMDMNANTLMRDPSWNEGLRACTVAINPKDATDLGLTDGQSVKVTTEAGSEDGELEIDSTIQLGTILIPHGFGMVHGGVKHGMNVNRLTKNTHRDEIAGTPLHRYVLCRVEGI